jgi:hypothetical protein
MTSLDPIRSRLSRPAAPEGVVTGAPNLILRAEGAAVLAAATAAFAATGTSWWVFAALFLAPDLSMLGYLAGPRAGAAVYNLGHTYVVTLAVLGLGLWAGAPMLAALGLIWTAHVGFDRMMGYGLKMGRGFKATHLSDGTAG